MLIVRESLVISSLKSSFLILQQKAKGKLFDTSNSFASSLFCLPNVKGTFLLKFFHTLATRRTVL